jgi:hypothetical protein
VLLVRTFILLGMVLSLDNHQVADVCGTALCSSLCAVLLLTL